MVMLPRSLASIEPTENKRAAVAGREWVNTSRWVLVLVTVGLMLSVALVLHRSGRQALPAMPAASMLQEPSFMLWSWESAEDLTNLNSKGAGVAFLAREVLLDQDLTVRPRFQPLRVAPGTWLLAVVRIETGARFAPSKDIARRSALAIAQAAGLPDVRALQIDFDATASQRDFYATVLRDLREDLPAGFPISVTALVSWCGPHSWLHDLPVDEAVPMFFRMGGPGGTRANSSRSQAVIAEPLCSGSVGLSTDEVWPAVRRNQRVYLFRPGPWTQDDIALMKRFGYEGLRGPASP